MPLYACRAAFNLFLIDGEIHLLDQRQVSALESLINAISTQPILAFTDYNQPFSMYTDASSSGLGAILFQKQDNIDRIIGYGKSHTKRC